MLDKDFMSRGCKDGVKFDKNKGDRYKKIIILKIILNKENKLIENLNCSFEINLEK